MVFFLLFGARIYCLFTYQKTIGKTVGYFDEYVQTRRGGYTKHYPEIAFENETGRHIFLAPSYMFDASRGMGFITVIYDKSDPHKAYALNFYGFWSPGFIYFLPFFLIWTIIIFSIDFVPTQINIKKIMKRNYIRSKKESGS